MKFGAIAPVAGQLVNVSKTDLATQEEKCCAALPVSAMPGHTPHPVQVAQRSLLLKVQGCVWAESHLSMDAFQNM